jgi:hypothetical protein
MQISRAMRRGAGVAATALLALAGHVSAQGAVMLRGRALDAGTNQPLVAAFVSEQGASQGALTDSLGRFVLQVHRAETYALRVRLLGYHDAQVTVGPRAATTPFTVMVTPDPVEIEGLTVLAERLAERRRGVFGAGELLERAELATAPDGSGYDLVRRVVPFARLCDPDSEELCVTHQGAATAVRVCVDGHRVPGALMETALAGLDPRGLYLVEVFARAGEVRMYTPGYVKRLMAAGASLSPLSFGCSDGSMGSE